MAGLLPQTADWTENGLPSKTWSFDPDTGQVGSWIQGEDALRQAIMLRLLIPRYEYLIYSFRYGSELASLIGRDHSYALAAAPALVEECLLEDDRIQGVSSVQTLWDGNALSVSFSVQSGEGNVSAAVSVNP